MSYIQKNSKMADIKPILSLSALLIGLTLQSSGRDRQNGLKPSKPEFNCMLSIRDPF